MNKKILVISLISLLFSSCSKLGYGVLLWTTDDPVINSGTVLPVFIRSNIDRVWVVGVPDSSKKIEIPLALLEFSGSKRKAVRRANEFAYFAPTYAENMQDGLPIREHPDNGSRRVYRLRQREIIKILEIVEGNPPISATGEPLDGDWYFVLTNEGVTGYCFSYRLKIFDHREGPLVAAPASLRETAPDPDLDMIFSRKWSPQLYQQMINSRRIDISEMEKKYRFDPGQDTGVAKIVLPDIEREFIYNSIIPDGERAWRFEGTNLQINLRTNTMLAVQFVEDTGSRRTLLFAALPSDIDDIIMQEYARRDSQFMAIYNQGPVFTSSNFGTITFSEASFQGGGSFIWTGFDLLVPQIIPAESSGRGRVLMNLFISPSFEDNYTGAFTFRLTDVTPNRDIHFMYGIDIQGLRLEVVPDFGIENAVVTRRSTSPMILYFFKDSLQYGSFEP